MQCSNCNTEIIYENGNWVHNKLGNPRFCWVGSFSMATPMRGSVTSPMIETITVPAPNAVYTVISKDDTNPKDLVGSKKVDLAQVLPVALVHEAQAMMDGTYKYGFRNFRDKKVQAMIYVAAAIRHIEAWAECEERAEDSGIHHLGHARACLGILLDAQENGNLVDDRKKGVFSKVLKREENWVKERAKNEDSKKVVTNAAPHTADKSASKEDMLYDYPF